MKSFLAVLEMAGVSAWVRDLRTDTLTVTQGIWTELGYPAGGSAQTGAEWRALIHPEDLPGHERCVSEHLAGLSEQLHSIFRLKHANHGWRVLETRGRVIERDDDDEPVMFGGVITDITPTSPLTSPALFKTVVENANEGIWMADLDGRTFFANARLAALLGTTPDEMIGRHPLDYCFPEDFELARTLLGRNFAGFPVEFEWRFRRRDGSEIPVLGTSAPIRDQMGTVTGSVAMFSDLTARKAAERALLESERQARDAHVRLAAAQEGAGAGTWETDLRARTVTLDRVSLRMHGLPMDTEMPLTFEQWSETVDSNGEEILSKMAKSVQRGGHCRFEFSTQGGATWILGLGRSLGGESGQPMKMVGLNLNITETKHAEKQLSQVRAELIHVARLSGMGSMASTIAHELNQPLAATINYLGAAEMMLARKDYAATLAAVKAASQTTSKAGDMIRRIRESAIKRNSARRENNLREIIESALQLALLDATQKGIHVQRHLRRNMRVIADAIQIEQVVINLVRNAVDAVSQRKDPTITISAKELNGRAVVQVRDNGAGVSPDIVDTVFDTFASSKETGMGLGLSICRTIIESHEGKIWLDGTSPDGTTFKFDLPLAV